MKIVIIGGVAAGAKAAAKSRRLLPDAEIDLYTDDTHVSYSSCGIPYYVEGNFQDYEMLLVRSPEEFAKDRIYIHLQNKVTKIIPQSKQILVESLLEKRAYLVEYDKLIIATGARPFIPEIRNVELNNVFTVRKIEDAINIRNKLKTSKKAVIIGGGYIGIEMLEAFTRQGVYSTLIEHHSGVMPKFDEDMSLIIKDQLTSISEGKFEILTNEIVTAFGGDNKGIHYVRTISNKEIDADIAVICTGIRPNVELAIEAGIELGKTGAIKVTNRMETSIPDIYACGDCVEENLLITNTPVWMPLGSNANKEGRCAAINACGFDETFDGVLSSAVTRCLGLTMSMTGLTENNAKLLGFEPISATVTKNDRVGYMPDVNNITIKMVADKKSGLILGGQAVGAGDADKRINTITSALLGRLTVKEFFQNDITYSPPYSPTIDPLLNATEILLQKLKGKW